jgi:hypothetical protein
MNRWQQCSLSKPPQQIGDDLGSNLSTSSGACVLHYVRAGIAGCDEALTSKSGFRTAKTKHGGPSIRQRHANRQNAGSTAPPRVSSLRSRGAFPDV